MSEVFEFINHYKLDMVLCAILVTLLTGLLKLPIKKLAGKMQNGKRITKYITFMPIILGFGITVLYTYLATGSIEFEQLFFTRWFSTVSLSLAIYAFWEKFVPSEKRILTDAEITANRIKLRELETMLQVTQSEVVAAETSNDMTTTTEEVVSTGGETATISLISKTDEQEDQSDSKQGRKIILRGGHHAEIEQK